MKRWQIVAMGLGVWTQAALTFGQGKAIPSIPANCASSVAEKGYCTETSFVNNGYPFTIRFFIVVDQSRYPDSDALMEKYLAFDDWPAYVDGSENIIYNKSIKMAEKVDAKGNTIYRHYADYKLKSPIGYQKVRTVVFNQRLAAPYAGAISSAEYAAQVSGPQEVPAGEKALTGAEGVRLQYGALHLVACPTNLCSRDQWVVIYDATITPTVSLLPKQVSAAVEKGITDIIVGMLFN